MNPAFNAIATADLIPINERKAKKFIDFLQRFAGEEIKQMHEFLFAVTLDTVTETFFDIDLDCQGGDGAEMLRILISE